MTFTRGMTRSQALRHRSLAVALLGLGLAVWPALGVRGADQPAVGQVTALAGQGVIFHSALREPQDLKVHFKNDSLKVRLMSSTYDERLLRAHEVLAANVAVGATEERSAKRHTVMALNISIPVV